jgi:hypothetical protein
VCVPFFHFAESVVKSLGDAMPRTIRAHMLVGSSSEAQLVFTI